MASSAMASNANSEDVVAAITMHRQEHQDDSSLISCGSLTINPKNIKPEDYEDTGCQLLLTTACAHAHEASILKRAEERLTEVQKANTVAKFFEAENEGTTPLVSPAAYEDILMKIALATSQEKEAHIVKGELVFVDEAARADCRERARNMSLYEMIVSLKKARLDSVRDMRDMQLKLVKLGKEWAAKVNMTKKLLDKGKADSASKKVADLKVDDLRGVLTANLRQKIWMDMFGQLSPHMSALAFGADMASAVGEGFETAKTEYDAAVKEEIKQTQVVKSYEIQVSKNKTSLKNHLVFIKEKGSEVEAAKANMVRRISSLKADVASLQHKLNNVPADKTEHSGGFLGIGGTTTTIDRSGQRSSLQAQISSVQSQISELVERERSLSPSEVKKANEEITAKIQASIETAEAQVTEQRAFLKKMEDDRKQKTETYKRCREATAAMLAKSGAATKEQALASLEAAQGVSGSMQNQSVKEGLFEVLSGNFADLIEAIETNQELIQDDSELDADLFEEIVTALEAATQNPLNRMLAEVVRVTPEPVEYAAMMSRFDPALQDKVFALKDTEEKKT